MKKSILLISNFICICFYAHAQMDNLVNVSQNWIASPARNAATNSSDVVVYNPSATTSLSEGFHINIGNQSLFRTPSHTYDLGMGIKTAQHQGSDPFLPNLYAAYTKNNYSVFTGIFISGGGASLNYPSGSITTDMIGFQSLAATQGAYNEASAQSLEASSYYLTTTIGAAYKFNNMISASLSLRYLNGTNKTAAGFTLTASPIDLPDMPMSIDYEETAQAINAVAGIFIQPSDRFGMSFRYESKAKMDFKTKLIHDDFGIVTDGSKNRRDLPAVMAFGASYKINDRITVLTDINYYSQTNADWGTTMNANGETIALSKAAGDAISYCIAVDYKINEKITVSAGGGYSDFMFNDMAAYYTHAGVFETVHNDNMNLNFGATYQLCKQLNLTAGFMNTSWTKDTNVQALAISPDNNVIINNSMNVIAVGIDVAF